MSDKALETWAWVLLYGGLLTACLGLFVRRTEAVAGTALLAIGGVAAVAGVVLVWWRSRRGR